MSVRCSGLPVKHLPKTRHSICKGVNLNSFEISLLYADHNYFLKTDFAEKLKKEKDCNIILPEIPVSQERYNGCPPLNGALWPTVSVTPSHTLWCQMVE